MPDMKHPSDDKQSDLTFDPKISTAGDALHINLIQSLLEQKIISAAQAQLLLADQQVTGMSIDEVILARGWISEAKLDEIAPWRKQVRTMRETLHISAGSKNYEQNFKQYRQLMEKILGMSWD